VNFVCSIHIRALRHIRPLLTLDATKTFAVAIVSSRLDYCNSLLQGTSAANLDRLQWVQDVLACAVAQAPWCVSSPDTCRSSLPQGPLHFCCIRRRPPASAICRYWSSTGSTRSDSHWAAEFRRQRTYHLEQSATSTTFAGSVAEHIQADTEDASLLIHPATLSRFKRDFAAAYKSADLLTYLLTVPLK